jgi:1-acyl-sn-glycerol-3-phosphate acyltransferase
MLQAVLIAAGVVLATIGFGVPAMLSAPLNPSGHLVHWFARWWGRTLLWIGRVPVRLHGLEHIPQDRACVLVSNHASAADIPILFGNLPFQFRVIAKESLFRIPILGWCMRLAGYISIDRSNPRKAVKSLKRAAQRLQTGLPVLVFPEGTRSRTGALQRFTAGAFLLAIEAGAPVVPVGISGSFDILVKGSMRVRPGVQIHVHIGSPIDTRGYKTRDRDRLAEEAHAAVAACLQRTSISKTMPEVRPAEG